VSSPVREALVLTDAGDAAQAVAGVPRLLRTILVLQRAGIERCTLVGRERPPIDPRIRCAVAVTPVLAPPADAALHVVVGPGAVIDDALVRSLLARARPGEVLEVERAGARVRIAPGPLVVGNGTRPLAPPAGTLEPAAAGPAVHERALLRALENPRDGFIDRLLYRRLSRPLTRLLLRAPLSPNAVTIIGVLIGLGGGILLAVPGVTALAAACLLASGVLDCSDGELARLRFLESRLGHLLDITGDTVVHTALLGGIIARLARTSGVPHATWLVLLGIGVLASFAAITWSDHTETRRRRVPAWENTILDDVLSPLTTRDWYVFPVAFALAGQLRWLVPAAAVGAQVFWTLVVVLVVRVLRRI
jgi:phosphatidylglycerophosphate synthase